MTGTFQWNIPMEHETETEPEIRSDWKPHLYLYLQKLVCGPLREIIIYIFYDGNP
jgi:hypothetical protein